MLVYLLTCAVGFGLSFILSVFLFLVSKKNLDESNKSSPFECGFLPFEESRVPYSIHFITVSMVFLIFDIELILLFPFVSSLASGLGVMNLAVFSLFLIILSSGLFVEWEKSYLTWTS